MVERNRKTEGEAESMRHQQLGRAGNSTSRSSHLTGSLVFGRVPTDLLPETAARSGDKLGLIVRSWVSGRVLRHIVDDTRVDICVMDLYLGEIRARMPMCATRWGAIFGILLRYPAIRQFHAASLYRHWAASSGSPAESLLTIYCYH
jgi:hypothetical protein